jgi:phytoene dehydrogenase-like protein
VTRVDVVVVGSGPNGLAAAVTLARAGLSVKVLEGAERAGGGCRTESSTLPGFRHDVCSAVHPLVAASPFFRQPVFDALHHAMRQPEIPFAHPLDGGRAAVARRSVADTADSLEDDGPAYRNLMGPLVRDVRTISDTVLAPLRSVPERPVVMARFGRSGILPATRLVRRFKGDAARALFAGVAAHSMSPLAAPLTGGFGLLLASAAHAVGWPMIEGGSEAITAAMVGELERLGGTVTCGRWVESLADLPVTRTVVLDLAPEGVLRLAASELSPGYRRGLRRFRYGPGVCKVDWALSGPVPWTSPACRNAGTLHLGGTFDEVATAEAEVAAGRHPDGPYCIIAQPGVADRTRAPAGHETLWGYCHVPSGSTVDMTAAIERQIERFAPGFSDLILARSASSAAQEAHRNPNYVGGDIGGGAATLRQVLFRPTVRWNPYRTSLAHVYLGSASTPPGGGVHGMAGFYAARTLLHDHFGGPAPFRPVGTLRVAEP